MYNKNKALFLDRDGVINIDHGYVHLIKDFVFIDGIFDLCQKALELGYIIIIVTNQGGIGKGLYSEEDFQKLTKWMLESFSKRNIKIAKVYHCPYHPDSENKEYKETAYDRKPSPGMLLKAKEEFDIDMQKSLIIGDKNTDIIAGKSVDIGKAILFGREESLEADYKISNLMEVLKYL